MVLIIFLVLCLVLIFIALVWPQAKCRTINAVAGVKQIDLYYNQCNRASSENSSNSSIIVTPRDFFQNQLANQLLQQVRISGSITWANNWLGFITLLANYYTLPGIISSEAPTDEWGKAAKSYFASSVGFFPDLQILLNDLKMPTLDSKPSIENLTLVIVQCYNLKNCRTPSENWDLELIDKVYETSQFYFDALPIGAETPFIEDGGINSLAPGVALLNIFGLVPLMTRPFSNLFIDWLHLQFIARFNRNSKTIPYQNSGMVRDQAVLTGQLALCSMRKKIPCMRNRFNDSKTMGLQLNNAFNNNKSHPTVHLPVHTPLITDGKVMKIFSNATLENFDTKFKTPWLEFFFDANYDSAKCVCIPSEKFCRIEPPQPKLVPQNCCTLVYDNALTFPGFSFVGTSKNPITYVPVWMLDCIYSSEFYLPCFAMWGCQRTGLKINRLDGGEGLEIDYVDASENGNQSESEIENQSESEIENQSESEIENQSESGIENQSESEIENESFDESEIENQSASEIENESFDENENDQETIPTKADCVSCEHHSNGILYRWKTGQVQGALFSNGTVIHYIEWAKENCSTGMVHLSLPSLSEIKISGQEIRTELGTFVLKTSSAFEITQDAVNLTRIVSREALLGGNDTIYFSGILHWGPNTTQIGETVPHYQNGKIHIRGLTLAE